MLTWDLSILTACSKYFCSQKEAWTVILASLAPFHYSLRHGVIPTVFLKVHGPNEEQKIAWEGSNLMQYNSICAA